LILGPLAETQFRRALAISQGDLSVFIKQPIAAAVLAVSALLLIIPLVFRLVRRV
jgi:putative tricarboxylic transport membrane protein